MGKSRKLPMERRQTQKEISVTFTKRRQGLFNKAAQLCMLCDAQIAVLVASPSKEQPKRKVYSFGNPSVPAVLDAFFHHRVPFPLDDHAKQSLLSLWNEVDSLESESVVRSSSNNNNNSVNASLKALDDFERCNSVEELQKLVDGLDKIIAKAKPRFDYDHDCNAGYANVTFDELKNCNMLSSTEDVVEDFKFPDCYKINGVGESSNSSQEADNWNLISSNEFLLPEDLLW